ncbi:MAG: glycosyltransferase [Chthoniobacteraceae bacterium]
MTNILQISPSDGAGGAEKIACELMHAYRRAGWNSEMAVGLKVGGDPGVFKLRELRASNLWKRAWRWLGRELRRRERLPCSARLDGWCHDLAEPVRRWRVRRGREDFDFPGWLELFALAGQAPSAVHCHNLHGGYFDLRSLAALSSRVPTLLTLHDAWLLSGHCAHSVGCDRWMTGCGHCPDLTLYPAVARDATAFNWQRKRAIYAGCRLYVSTPCRWLMAKVERSMLAPAILGSRVIPNGTDLSVFRPGDRLAARHTLGIPADAKVVLIAGKDLRTNAWKNFPAALEAVAGASAKMGPMLVLAVGDSGSPEKHGDATVRFLSHQAAPEDMARCYRAADLCLHLAKADTFPTVVIEALACGTPVVATDVGGIPEQIESGVTGLTVPPGEAEAATEALVELFANPGRRLEMAAAAATAGRRFGRDEMERRYVEWLREILSDSRGIEPAHSNL